MSKYTQQHNAIPLGFNVAGLVAMIFVAGQLYAQFDQLKADFREYRNETNVRFDRLEEKQSHVFSKGEDVVVVGKNNQVLGIATTSASLTSTPQPTPVPTKRPVIIISPTKAP